MMDQHEEAEDVFKPASRNARYAWVAIGGALVSLPFWWSLDGHGDGNHHSDAFA